MAQLKRENILQIAKLAHLEIAEAEIPVRLKEFNDILGYIEKLNGLSTEGIEPTAQVGAEQGRTETPMAEDTASPSFTPDEAMKNAPARQDHFFKVPRMIGNEE